MDWYHMKEYAFLARLVTARTQSETLCSRCQHTYRDPQLHFFCVCTGFSQKREFFWEEVVDEVSPELSALLWTTKELTETLLGMQLPSVDFEDMIILLGIVATCWYTV
jgi:hypothetical protein